MWYQSVLNVSRCKSSSTDETMRFKDVVDHRDTAVAIKVVLAVEARKIEAHRLSELINKKLLKHRRRNSRRLG